MKIGVSSMTAPLRAVALRSPGTSLINADPKIWHYGSIFDSTVVSRQHAEFASHLEESGVEILWMDGDDRGIADSVFTYDASLMTPAGAILMKPGKPLRAGEQDLHKAFYDHNKISVLGEISGAAHAEAGDTLWLDDKTLAVGRGFRTNQAGVQQLSGLLAPLGISVQAFDMPYYLGADACLHLMSLVSLVEEKTALICQQLLPVTLWQLMQEMGFNFIDAPFDEFKESGTLSLNILAITPGKCVMVRGYPKTSSALENAGIKLHYIDAEALCVGCEGGPTCLTRPIHRA